MPRLGRQLFVAVSAICFAALASTAGNAQSAPDYSGSYRVNGINPQDKPYKGKATIARVRGQIYNISWDIIDRADIGTCLAEASRLSCGYRAKGESSTYTGVIVFLLEEDGKLAGKWADEGGVNLGREKLTPSRK